MPLQQTPAFNLMLYCRRVRFYRNLNLVGVDLVIRSSSCLSSNHLRKSEGTHKCSGPFRIRLMHLLSRGSPWSLDILETVQSRSDPRRIRVLSCSQHGCVFADGYQCTSTSEPRASRDLTFSWLAPLDFGGPGSK